MNSDAALVSAWESQDSSAQALERIIKTARRFPDEESLSNLQYGVADYLAKLEYYLGLKAQQPV